jgi:hypothetical protein
MKNFNVQNKVNNTKGSKKTVPMIIAAIVTIAGAATMLTGCGSETVPAAATTPTAITTSAAVTSTATATAKVNANAKSDIKPVSAVNNSQNVNTAANVAESANTANSVIASNTGSAVNTANVTPASITNSDNIGVDRETAIANVREQVGSGAQILSCEKGVSPEGFNCWVIKVAPVTNGNGPDSMTYFSGYQFCYCLDSSIHVKYDDGQNPMMNFIGNYTNGRAMMTANCISQTEASIDISWSSSAFETTIWKMSGTVATSNEGVSIWYDNCTKQTFKYTEDGQLISDDIEYENGSGSICFMAADNNAYWYDAVEGAGAGTSFWYYN